MRASSLGRGAPLFGHENPLTLQINEDNAFQKRTWRFERGAWVLFGAMLAAALAGLLGPGPLSARTVGAADGSLRVAYERFAHVNAPTTLRLEIPPGAESDPWVWINQAYLDDLQVEGVTPPPSRVESSQQGLLFAFARTDGSAILISFHLRPRRAGRLEGRVGTAGDADVRFAQFIYP